MRARKHRIRELNEELRQQHRGGTVVVTAGVQALGAELILQIDDAVARFDGFDDDRYGEHDFGSVEVSGHTSSSKSTTTTSSSSTTRPIRPTRRSPVAS